MTLKKKKGWKSIKHIPGYCVCYCFNRDQVLPNIRRTKVVEVNNSLKQMRKLTLHNININVDFQVKDKIQ